MKSIEEQLREYGSNMRGTAEEESIVRTLAKAKMLFFGELEGRPGSYFDFLYQQMRYMKKRWWALQAGVLVILWWVMHEQHTELLVQRSMGILAALFAVLLIPELWKNKVCRTMEIETAAFYSLRQIYAARMLVFAIVDGVALSMFTALVSLTTSVGMEEMLIHFFVPFSVTCGILFGTLCSNYISSEFWALFLTLLWSAIWMRVVIDNELYQRISLFAWTGMLLLAVVYLFYMVRKTILTCEDFLEVGKQWN